MTTHELTDTQIERLRTESANAGDALMVMICDRALDELERGGKDDGDGCCTICGFPVDGSSGYGSLECHWDWRERRRAMAMDVDDARAECARVIADAAAMAD